MFVWNAEMIRLMEDASRRGGYYERLAQELLARLPRTQRVCDAGCGLGYLACAAAPRCGEVTAVDLSPEAIGVLRRTAAERGLANVRPLCGDVAALPPEQPYDAMIFSYFGRMRQILEIGRAQCRGRLAVVKKNYREHRFSLGRVALSDETADDASALLQRAGVPFSREDCSFEMGQPFRTAEDAALFFRLYSRDGRPEEITPQKVLPRLRETGDAEFPYYLPQEKRCGLLFIDTAEIPPDWEERI